MATSVISYLDIISVVGFKRSASHDGTNPPALEGGLNGPRPIMTTTLTLEGITQPDIEFGDFAIIDVDTLEEFVTYPGGTTNYQTVKVTNKGNVPVTVLNITSSTNSVTPIISTANSINFPVIPVGSTGTFELAYSGEKKGIFTNWIKIDASVETGLYKVLTTQFIDDILDFVVTPSTVNISIGSFNEVRFIPILLTPKLNNVIDNSIDLDFTYSIAGSSAWSVAEVSTNKIILKFDSKVVNNTNNNYTATLSIDDVDVSLNATIGIVLAENVNLGSWISSFGSTNSVVGVSYDKIENVRTITIGVCYKDDTNTGVDIFPEGANEYISVSNLGLGAEFLDIPFTYWHTVYRIPLDLNNPSKNYYSNDYVVKSQDFDYGKYFGENQAPNSIFIVKCDQYGNVEIFVNNLRIPIRFDENAYQEFNSTELTNIQNELKDIYYAFYYYVPFRITKLENPSMGVTKLFIGFDNNGMTRTNNVPIPPEP